MTPEDVQRLAAEHYGVTGTVEPLPAEYAQNFRLRADDGATFVFKVVRREEEDAVLDLQHRTLEHLAAAALPLATPRVVPARSGKEIVSLQDGTRIRLLTYLTGTLWVDQQERPAALLGSLGAALGTVDRALEDFHHPAAGRHHPWDLAHARERWSWVEAIPDPDRRALADHCFHRFAACAEPYFGDLPRSVIHGDANDYNLLVAGSGDGLRVTGLLDFGDMVETFTVVELAVALAYALLHGEEAEDPLAGGAEIVAGYHRVRPLAAVEQAALFPLVLARLALSVVTAARRRRTRPDEAYLFVTEAPAWALLERLAALSPETARERLCAHLNAGHRGAGTSPTSPDKLLDHRRRRIGPSLSVAYDAPLKIVRGRGPYLYDHRGRPYLDLVNNVCHVGHCHPRVVEAGARQMAVLNTNTRYLYDGLTDYADRLCATLPEPLSVCYFVCSGSEANELALRLARAHTGRRGIVVLEGAYHGHTTSLIDISPYKFLGAGGAGRPEPHVQIAPMPDCYRVPDVLQGESDLGEAFGETVRRVIERGMAAEDPQDQIGAFLCEPFLSCGGQILPPPGYLAAAYRHTRAAGGVCIADEVQVGFGRVGSHFWAFDSQGVLPDIVVLGKPIGNGHPLAAVITTPEIAASFANGMEFFSTFGGNPVSCAIGLAVLDVIEDEGLQEHARRLGLHALERFRALMDRHPLIGDVRGQGLFLGIELVRDRGTQEPAAEEATALIQRLRHRGILLSTDGPLHNVLKIKPPMVLTEGDIDRTARELDRGLGELAGR
jgi:4-aminobutyrate aminotransferase-like enzyme/Ser/Thr protein kinase RdoA (MazF antagonist)